MALAEFMKSKLAAAGVALVTDDYVSTSISFAR